MGKHNRGPSLEAVARMVLQRRVSFGELLAAEHEESDDGRSRRSKVTLPRLRFLERPLPAWWNENFERRPVMNDPRWQPPK